MVAGAHASPPAQDRRPSSAFTIDAVLQRNLPAHGAEGRRVALVFGDQEVTFEQLDARASALASGLLAHGFRHGDKVCMLARNRLEWFELLFALARIGGVLIPVNYLLKPREIAYLVEDSGARWMLGEDALWDTVRGVLDGVDRDLLVVSIGTVQDDALDYEAICATDGPPPPAEQRADDLLILQYTSGTTGFPKGAMHTHETVLWNSLHQIPDFGITRDDVHLVIPAMCWAAGFHSFTLAVLWAGGRVVINPSRGFTPEAFCATVEQFGITKTILVPAVLRRVLAYPGLERHDLSSLGLALSGGEPVPVQLIEEWHRRIPSCALVQGYGMGEFPTLMLLLEAPDAVRKAGAAGKACLAARIRVVDPDFRDTPAEEVGEIVVLSPACMVGYYGKPEATAETFHDGWMRTGDLARVDGDGFIHIAGRAKELVIVGGLNVYPAEVERVLLDLDSVAEVAVVGVPDPDWGEVPEAVVVVRDGRSVSPSELDAHCRTELANYKVPRRWDIRTEALPRTTSGKIQRHLVAQQARRAARDRRAEGRDVTLRGRSAVVAAAGSGIGRMSATALAEAGAAVALIDLDGDAVTDLARELSAQGHEARAFQADLTDVPGVRGIAARIAETMPAVDVLLSNVGAPNPHGIDDITEEQWQRAVDINLKSGFFVTQAFLPLIRATGRGGSIIYTSSAAGLVGSYTTPLYSLTKAGLVGLTRSLCSVLAPEAIRVNAICPGPVNTPMLPGFLAKAPDEAGSVAEVYASRVPLGRVAEPEEIARAVVFLASEAASFITGVALPVDGGYTAV